MESTKFNANVSIPQSNDSKPTLKDPTFRSKITQSIGHGEDAKNSIIYLILKYSFISGCILTAILTLNFWIEKLWGNPYVKSEDFISHIIKSWQIIIPVITLTLGYAFGQSKK